MKKILAAGFALVVSAFFAATAMASQEDVVKQLLTDAGTVKIFSVSAADTAAIQAGLGNMMPVRPQYEIYESTAGAVVIEEQQGKWGMIKLAVLIDPANKTVKSIALISMNEKRGVGIKQANFMNQFTGKSAQDLTEINKGIRAVSGATVSSKAVFIAAKRALLVYGLFAAGR